MHHTLHMAGALLLVATFLSTAAPVLAQKLGPQPGDVYREFVRHQGGNDWRVTDPDAAHPGAAEFLPNPVLEFTIDDFSGALRAEAMLDRWGGHPDTSDKQIRFNGNEWIVIPEPVTMPEGQRPERYFYQDNPIVEVPLSHLREGVNTFEGTCGTISQSPRHWGQWGLYSLILRIYYDPAQKPHATGRIVSPEEGDVIGEDPEILLESSKDEAIRGVDFLAYYEGYDEDGDGVFRDWHRNYQQPLRGMPAEIAHHVGTATAAPYRMIWDTQWVPDQPSRSVAMIARIQDVRGTWYVTEPVEALSFERTSHSVRLYRSFDVPQRFGVRIGATARCAIEIPAAHDLTRAVEAKLHLRTWHGFDGHHGPFEINGWAHEVGGKNHHFDYAVHSVPVSVLKHGSNVVRFHSDFGHHALEVLWPGPALVVRYEKRD